MTKYYYKKGRAISFKTIARLLSALAICSGIFVLSYVLFPIISWNVYFAPVRASASVAAPIPQTTIVNKTTIENLLQEASKKISGVDYTNALNWFPPTNIAPDAKPKISEFTLSIPKLGIRNAVVSTQDFNLGMHLINYIGTAIPPDNGTAVVFGHSTLPQLFNPKDYKTIFAKAYLLEVGDDFFATTGDTTYRYKIFEILVVDANDTSVFSQNYDNSYMTLVTCTPPGTTWKRLLIKARLEKI